MNTPKPQRLVSDVLLGEIDALKSELATVREMRDADVANANAVVAGLQAECAKLTAALSDKAFLLERFAKLKDERDEALRLAEIRLKACDMAIQYMTHEEWLEYEQKCLVRFGPANPETVAPNTSLGCMDSQSSLDLFSDRGKR